MTAPNAACNDVDYFDRLADCDDALAAGTPADESWCDRETPDFRPRLQRDLNCLRQLQSLRPSRAVEAPTPHRIGRFLIQREIGRGGFGVVLLADDPRLDRPVALKVPRADFLADNDHRNRFHTEAQAAARLDHPNIVTVYEAGEAGPVVYIASAYCPGLSLAQWLRQDHEPVAWRDAATLIATLADAVDYAHRHGVLHRDLKPANILLTQESTDADFVALHGLTPKITDFGLAKLTDADPTQSYAALGTPSYMPPEQAAGRTVDIGPASDVYSLGAILYELWTGRPPFQGQSSFDVLQQVQWQEPLSPARLRPGLPRDLETICCKCLEKEPRHRYATAGELARDLRHSLAGEPIQARPISTYERVWRWCRRNPLPASLTAAIALLLPAALLVVTGLYWQAEREAKRADELAIKNAAERDKAIANYQRARAAVQRLARLGNEISDRPGLDRAQARVYEEVLQHCLTFLTDSADDPTIRLDTARAWRQVGCVRLQYGKTKDAADAFDHEAALLDALLSDEPDNRDLLAARARCDVWRGHALRRIGQSALAIQAYRDSIRRCEAIDNDEHVAAQMIHATAWANLGSLVMTDNLQEADEAIGHAVSKLGRLSDQMKGNRGFLYDYALALDTLARIRIRQGRPGDGEEASRNAVLTCQAALQKWPNDANSASYLARSRVSLATILSATGRLEEAEQSARDARDSLIRLTADYPGVFDYRWTLVSAHDQLGLIQERQFRLTDASSSWLQAINLQQTLAADFPDRSIVRSLLGMLHCRLARVCSRLDQTANCLEQLRAAVSLIPDDALANNQLAWTLAMCPELELRNLDEARRRAEAATRGAPKNGDCWNTLGAALYVSGDYRPALQALQRAESLRPRQEVDDYLLMSLCHSNLGESEQARTYFNKAEAIFANDPPKDPYTTRLRTEAGKQLNGE